MSHGLRIDRNCTVGRKGKKFIQILVSFCIVESGKADGKEREKRFVHILVSNLYRSARVREEKEKK